MAFEESTSVGKSGCLSTWKIGNKLLITLQTLEKVKILKEKINMLQETNICEKIVGKY